MNYQETIDFLYGRLPVFHNIGARAFKPGLDTTRRLCEAIGNPENNYPCIHVGGTNGKGSTSHMIAAVLQKSGYRVGLYTSPHLKSFTERIRIDGQPVEEQFVVDFTVDNLSNIDKFEPSFFELTVAMAFYYFSVQHVDVAVIEVGMGGRLDSTNIITPILSIITNVSYDHTQFLGNTIQKIAAEKAGIIKPGVPVIISEYQEETEAVFTDTTERLGSVIGFASRQVNVARLDSEDGLLHLSVSGSGVDEQAAGRYELDLPGHYQEKNIAGVLSSINILRKNGFDLPAEAVREALRNVVTLTGLKGRWQKLGEQPLVYCDTAHNFAGLSQTLQQFSSISSTTRRFVIGFVSDKDISTILTLFPVEAEYYFTQPSNARALPVSELALKAAKTGLKGHSFANVNAGLEKAIDDSSATDTIYVGGSTFVVSDLHNI